MGTKDDVDVANVGLPAAGAAKLAALFAQLKTRARPEQLARLELYAHSVLSRDIRAANPLQQPGAGYFPGLTAKPWWDPEERPYTRDLAASLESGYRSMRDELVEKLGGERFSPERGELFERYGASRGYETVLGNDWGGMRLVNECEITDSARRHFPRALEVLAPLLPSIVNEAVYLLLKPGVELPRHTDLTNAQLSCHLGMIVPERCGIEVAGEERSWQEGKVLLFDHSFPHTAWNRSAFPRVVLLLDVAHPDMTPLETQVCQEAARMKLFAAM